MIYWRMHPVRIHCIFGVIARQETACNLVTIHMHIYLETSVLISQLQAVQKGTWRDVTCYLRLRLLESLVNFTD
jgi:hypothetical protein